MKVYNLTPRDVIYKGKKVPPNGGSVEIADSEFTPSRDLALQAARVLAFGSLPSWWVAQQPKVVAPVPPPKPATQAAKVTITMDTPADVADKSQFSMSNKKK